MPNLERLDLTLNVIESIEFLKYMPSTLRHSILDDNKIMNSRSILIKNLE